MIPKPISEASTAARKLLDRLASPLECLANLTFLASEEAEHSQKVCYYMHMAEKQMQLIRLIALETYEA